MDGGALTQMTPLAFIRKWKDASLTERQSAQEHFLDLCSLLGHPTPTENDPSGEFFAFEKGAGKVGGGRGFADVWKKDHFAWEYKQKGGNLDNALLQLMRYAPALENPPLHVVCDIDRFRIHTAWTNTLPATYEIQLEELANPVQRDILHHVFFRPERLKPTRTRAGLTTEAADKFSTIASRLQGRGTAEDIAHFVNQLVFCFFAQSVALLPDGLFTKLLKRAAQNPKNAGGYLDKLFEAMEGGGEFDLNDIAWFNGGLFDGRRSLPVEDGDIGLLIAADSLDWSLIDPTIFGTLFERFLNPKKRAQIGAHYTDADKIERIIEPVVMRPLRAEWETARQEIAVLLSGHRKPPMREKERRRMTADEAAEEVRSRFIERLRNLRILDPACGSGNFLYLALQGVKDIENRANLDCEMLGLQARLPSVGPEILRGIEINALAAELARTTIWIGDIQWRLRNGVRSKPIPILRKLDNIETADALIDGQRKRPDKPGTDLLGQEAPGTTLSPPQWPEAEFIVGNPPFLGIRLMRQSLGDDVVDGLFALYEGKVSREADLVCYWFERSLAALNAGHTKRVGLVATNSIRGGANRKVLDQIVADSRIFEAWSDEPWIVDGAAVRVSLVCFGEGDDTCRLDGEPVARINANLTAGLTDLSRAQPLRENLGVAFMGDTKGGAFDIPGSLAREWLRLPLNPNGRSNSDVLRPWRNGMDITRRNRDMWIIDFGWEMSEREASFYEAPFQYVREHVLPERERNRRDAYRERWWRHLEPRPGMAAQLSSLKRYISTPRVSKYRVFSWTDSRILADSAAIAIARSDDTSFGILHSRFHETWSLRSGTWLGVGNDPRYTPSTTFETFPFPDGLSLDIPAVRFQRDSRAIAIVIAAKRLDDLRNAWLNPSDLVRIEPEVVPGYPDRILPKDTIAAAILRERTLTNLYNRRPQWLVDAHSALDAAVATAYGWPVDISEDDALARLLDLNRTRAAAETSQPRLAKRISPKAPDEVRRQGHLTLPIDGAETKQPRPNFAETSAAGDVTLLAKKPRRRRSSA
jgi:type II restriction/modification system DNA methylase subunit YeeA